MVCAVVFCEEGKVMFIGRKKELEILSDFYNDTDAGILCVTGQKGMGKTTLLKEFAKDKKHIFHISYPTTDAGQMMLFSRSVEEFTGTVDFANTSNLDKLKKEYSEAYSLSELLSDIKRTAEGDKVLLIIDQYYDFVKADSSYEKTLHEFLMENPENNNIKLIVCGDPFLAMDKYVLSKKSIWKNDKVTEIHLKAMGFYEASEFYPDKTAEEKAFLYGITGGIPAHLQNVGENVKDTVSSLFLDGDNPSTAMPEDTMSIDVREPANYNRMLIAVAQGNNRVIQLSAVVNKPKDVIVPYLKALMAIDVVEKNNAITEKNNRKKTRYGIVNTNHLFWYRYIAPNIDMYYNGKLKDSYEELIAPELSDFMKIVFINICKEYIRKKADAGKMPFTVDEVGNWWENDEEKRTTAGFDIVSLGKCNEKPCTVFARCYYSGEPIEMATLKDLIEMTKHVKAEGDVFYIVFSKSGFHENTLTVAGAIKNIMLITLDDVVTL